MTTISASADATAKRVLRRAAYDFGDVHRSPHALVAKPDRHGVRVVVAPTTGFSDRALDALLAWRLGQYLLTGFYDPVRVVELGLSGEPRASIQPSDLHGLALDRHGELLCYVTLKRPPGADGGSLFGDRERPLFPCEEVHGRAWQSFLEGSAAIPLGRVWEVARFCRDQRRGPLDVAARRAPLELGLAIGRSLRHPRHGRAIGLLIGDFDPEVALRSVRYFFVPVATFTPHHVELGDGHPLRPRYRRYLTAPFALAPEDVDAATYVRWVDVDLALACDDSEAARRLVALRRFVSVKESGLKRPTAAADPGPYPLQALTSSSSGDASASLWEAAGRGSLRWRALELGPGDALDPDEVVWVIDGFVQAFTRARGGRAHLAGIGAEVAYVPPTKTDDVLLALEAAMPVRALATTREAFEDYWARRQRLFETATQALYGDVAMAQP